MAIVAVLAQAWERGRAEAAGRRTRARASVLALLVSVVVFAARRLPRWQRLRSTVMQYAGFGLLTCSAFQWHLLAGLVSAGLSLLILEALGRGEG